MWKHVTVHLHSSWCKLPWCHLPFSGESLPHGSKHRDCAFEVLSQTRSSLSWRGCAFSWRMSITLHIHFLAWRSVEVLFGTSALAPCQGIQRLPQTVRVTQLLSSVTFLLHLCECKADEKCSVYSSLAYPEPVCTILFSFKPGWNNPLGSMWISQLHWLIHIRQLHWLITHLHNDEHR